MNEKDCDLLMKDLCARLPYGVKCQFEDDVRLIDGESSPFYDYTLSAHHLEIFMRHNNFRIKPYLRPMSSMTEEEEDEYEIITRSSLTTHIDWLNKNMFDYRGLIKRGLALEAPKGMYST